MTLILFMPFINKYKHCHYGQVYICDHPIYDICTLFKINGKGLAVIQQRFDSRLKTTCWAFIDEEYCDEIYLNENFLQYFNDNSDLPSNDIYPTVTLRQILHALKIKAPKKEYWETVFDRKIYKP